MPSTRLSSLLKNKTLVGYPLLFITMLIWGAFTLLSRLGAANTFTPWDLVAMRFATGTVVLLPIVLWRGELAGLWRLDFWLLALSGGVGYASLAFLGFSHAHASHAALWMNGCLPFWMAITSMLLLKERLTVHTLASLLLIALGILGMVVLMRRAGHMDMGIGDIYFFMAAAAWAVYTALIKRSTYSPWQILSAVVMLSSLIYLPIYILYLPKRFLLASPQELGMQIIFQGFVVLIIAMLTYIGAIQRLGAFKVGMLLALAPLLAALAAVPLLHEALPTEVLVGLIAVSLAAVQPWRLFLRVKQAVFIEV